MLRVEGLSHAFKNGSETTLVLQNISFHVRKGEMIALLGSSGSGKSTLLNLMAGLMKPTEGEIYIADHNIVKMNENKLAEFRRRHIGFIFQAYELLPNLTVRENIEMPLVFHSTRPSVRKQKALQLLEQVGIPRQGRDVPVPAVGRTAAAGQHRPVADYRAFGHLRRRADREPGYENGGRNFGDPQAANKTMNTTFIIVTHEREVAKQTQKIITLLDGQLEMSQPAVEPQAEAKEVQAENQRSDKAVLGSGAAAQNVTMLCAAGLSIGCAAIILAMSIGESTQQIVESELNSFLKMDEITVMPNSGGMPGRAIPTRSAKRRKTAAADGSEARGYAQYEACNGCCALSDI